jgi:hypothetical protein
MTLVYIFAATVDRLDKFNPPCAAPSRKRSTQSIVARLGNCFSKPPPPGCCTLSGRAMRRPQGCASMLLPLAARLLVAWGVPASPLTCGLRAPLLKPGVCIQQRLPRTAPVVCVEACEAFTRYRACPSAPAGAAGPIPCSQQLSPPLQRLACPVFLSCFLFGRVPMACPRPVSTPCPLFAPTRACKAW